MKKILAALVLANLFCLPSQALPGWTSDEVRFWVMNHKFLVNDFKETDADKTWFIYAHKDLDDGKRVEIRYENSKTSDSRNVTYKIVKLSEVLIKPLSAQDGGVNEVWLQNSPKAVTLLEQIYDKKLADDFKQAQPAFDGMDYYAESTVDSFRRANIATVPTQTDGIWDQGKIKILKGKAYAYELDEKNAQLTIFPLAELADQIAILQHNQKIYAEYLQHEKSKGPAKPH